MRAITRRIDLGLGGVNARCFRESANRLADKTIPLALQFEGVTCGHGEQRRYKLR